MHFYLQNSSLRILCDFLQLEIHIRKKKILIWYIKPVL